jgi:hypothetical protein
MKQIFIFLSICVIACSSPKKEKAKNNKDSLASNDTSSNKSKAADSVTVSTDVVIGKDETCECARIKLPLVTSASSKEIQDKINKTLSFEALGLGNKNEICKCTESMPYGLTDGTFDISCNKGNILSIRWNGTTFQEYNLSSFPLYRNFDTRTGDTILLSDVYDDEGIKFIISRTDWKINSRLKGILEDKEAMAEWGPNLIDLPNRLKLTRNA